MPDLLKRVVSKVDGPVRACLVPDQIYIDLHWNWTGWIRRGSPIVGFSGHEHHVALAIWSLWQNWPIVGKGPCKRLCKWEGCCNPHHFVFPMEPTPAPMTFSLTGDPGEEAAAELMRRHKEMERLIAEGPSE
jgi:hypothetical protein